MTETKRPRDIAIVGWLNSIRAAFIIFRGLDPIGPELLIEGSVLAVFCYFWFKGNRWAWIGFMAEMGIRCGLLLATTPGWQGILMASVFLALIAVMGRKEVRDYYFKK